MYSTSLFSPTKFSFFVYLYEPSSFHFYSIPHVPIIPCTPDACQVKHFHFIIHQPPSLLQRIYYKLLNMRHKPSSYINSHYHQSRNWTQWLVSEETTEKENLQHAKKSTKTSNLRRHRTAFYLSRTMECLLTWVHCVFITIFNLQESSITHVNSKSVNDTYII